VLFFGAPKIVEILINSAFWHSLSGPSRFESGNLGKDSSPWSSQYKISLFGPLFSVGITKNYIRNCSFLAHSYNLFIHFASETIGKASEIKIN
jgi:hypothetical protein